MQPAMEVETPEADPRQATVGPLLLKGGSLEQALSRLEAVLRPGDLVFVEARGWVYRQVARATGSWTSQVGLVLRDSRGEWVVYEAAVPLVRRVPLARFVRRTRGNRFAVRRLRPGVSDGQLARLAEAAEHCVGRFNALGFDYDSNQLFCTKLIREVFHEAIDVELGRLTTLADLQHRLPASTLRFWRFWYLGAIPWRRRTITPHSLYTDPALDTVFESF